MNACPVAISEARHNSGRGEAFHDAVTAHAEKIITEDHAGLAWGRILAANKGRLADAVIALCVKRGLARDLALLLDEHAPDLATRWWRDDQ